MEQRRRLPGPPKNRQPDRNVSSPVSRRSFLLSTFILLQGLGLAAQGQTPEIQLNNKLSEIPDRPLTDAFHFHQLDTGADLACKNGFSDEKTKKQWTESEKTIIENHLRQIQSHSPLFAKNIFQCSSICLCRTTEPIDTRGNDTVSVYAAAIFRTIAISDSFFESDSKHQLQTLVHELIHILDEGGVFSYKADWITFAAPFIQDNLDQNSPWEGPDRLLRKGEVLCANAVESLGEAYAYYGTASLLNEKFTEAEKVRKLILPSLLADDCNPSLASYRKAVNCFTSSYYKKALEELDSAVHLNKDNAAPVYFQALCFFKLRDFQGAVAASLKFSELMSKVRANVTPIDWRDLSTLRMRTLCQAKLGLIDDSLETVEEILKKDPTNSFAIRFRDFFKHKSIRQL